MTTIYTMGVMDCTPFVRDAERMYTQDYNGNKSKRPVKNQWIITRPEGKYFQSYNSLVAFIPNDKRKKILLDAATWKCSLTTTRFLDWFLAVSSREYPESMIKSGKAKVVENLWALMGRNLRTIKEN